LYFARIDFLLNLNISFANVFVNPDRGGAKTDRPKFVPPVYLLDPGETLANRSACIGFDLANNGRHGLLGGNHKHQVHRIDLDTQRLDCNVRVALLDSEQALFQGRLEFTLQDLFTILGEPHNMVLMVVCAVGTELDLHTPMVAKPSNDAHIGFQGRGM